MLTRAVLRDFLNQESPKTDHQTCNQVRYKIKGTSYAVFQMIDFATNEISILDDSKN